MRWAALQNEQGVGLLVVSDPVQNVGLNACHYTADDLASATHPFELPERDHVVLNVDWKQQGVGGDDSWGAWPHEEYLIPCEPQSYRFRLRPIASDEDIAQWARTQYPD